MKHMLNILIITALALVVIAAGVLNRAFADGGIVSAKINPKYVNP